MRKVELEFTLMVVLALFPRSLASVCSLLVGRQYVDQLIPDAVYLRRSPVNRCPA
jgi:hypothetical protein